MTSASGAPGYIYYEPRGRLSFVYNPAGTVINRYDGERLVGEFAGGVDRRYVHGPGVDEPLVWYEGAGTGDRRWFHADERGSIVAVSAGSGGSEAIIRYDDYGRPHGPAGAGTMPTRFGYTGQTWLPELGMWYYKARIYNPGPVGGSRFMQTDPSGYADGPNLYTYTLGDSVNHTDPDGQATWVLGPATTMGGSIWEAAGALLGPAAPVVVVAGAHALLANVLGAHEGQREQTLAGDTVSARNGSRNPPVAGTGRGAGRPQYGAVRPEQSGPPRVVRPTHGPKKSDAQQEAGRQGRHGGVIGSRGDRRGMGGRQDSGHRGGPPHGHPPEGRGRGHLWERDNRR